MSDFTPACRDGGLVTGREGGDAGKFPGTVNVLKRHRVQSSLAWHRRRGEGGRQLLKKFRTKGKRFYQKWTRAGINTGFHKFRFSQNPCGCSLDGALEPKRSTRTQGLVKPTSLRRPTERFVVANAVARAIAEDGCNTDKSLRRRSIGISQTTFLEQT